MANSVDDYVWYLAFKNVQSYMVVRKFLQESGKDEGSEGDRRDFPEVGNRFYAIVSYKIIRKVRELTIPMSSTKIEFDIFRSFGGNGKLLPWPPKPTKGSSRESSPAKKSRLGRLFIRRRPEYKKPKVAGPDEIITGTELERRMSRSKNQKAQFPRPPEDTKLPFD